MKLCCWDGNRILQGADVVDEKHCEVRLYVPTVRRGRFNPGRLLIQTYFPVGLFRTWSWVDLDVHAVVYPRPVASAELPAESVAQHEGEILRREGVDDFAGLRAFQKGDALKHVAWKSFARTDELQIKEFAAFVDDNVWLDWDLFPGMHVEDRLSRLCYFVVRLSAEGHEYGLRIPGITIPPGGGGCASCFAFGC